MIDGLLIERQRDEDRNNRNRRHTGKTAAEKLFGHIKNNNDRFQNHLAIYCFVVQNVLSCLKTVFADGGDFIGNPSVINRNYIGHGMGTRQASQKDCIQLYLLYMNLMHILVDLEC